ncbi:MAG: hypothetical protein ACRYFZ_03540 [Janthinobacterium lividum]
MDFTSARNNVEGMYSTFLESGGIDTTALEMGAHSAWQALRNMSAAQVESLKPEQQRDWAYLVQAYNNLPNGVDGQRWQRRWFEAAHELLLRVPD